MYKVKRMLYTSIGTFKISKVKVSKSKVPHWGTSTPRPQGLLCYHPEGVPSFISRGAAHRTVYSASNSEGRNYVKGI
jgi:hypothetical protein